MRRRVLVVLGVVALGVFAWVGWPRGEAPDAGAPQGPASGTVSSALPDDGAATSDATSTDEVEPSEVAAGDLAAGDPAAAVTSEPEFDGPAPQPPVEATWDDGVRAAARDAARTAVLAFAATHLGAGEWWEQLAPHLTPQARPVYKDVDPRLVPVRTVTGEPVVTDETSTLLARVSVPTDVGPYTVLLVRADAAAPWLAEQIRPAEES